MPTTEQLVTRLLEAPMDTGSYPDFTDPERKQKLARRTHPLAKNPAYPAYQRKPEHKATNFEEFLASGQYQETVKKLNNYMTKLLRLPAATPYQLRSQQQGGQIMMMVQNAVRTAIQLEQTRKPQLEKLAVELLWELPEFKQFKAPHENKEFEIRASLKKPNLQGARVEEPPPEEEQEEPDEQEEPPEQGEVQAAEIAQDLDLEKSKRQFINAMIQGAGISRNYAFHFFSDALNAIDPNLMNYYGITMSFAELSYFMMPEAAQAAQAMDALEGGGDAEDFNGPAGAERVWFDHERGIWVVQAEAVMFPVLIQELVKGMTELVSYGGLPDVPEEAQAAIDKADLLNDEVYSVILGRGLWNQFMSQLDTDSDELAMFIYSKLIKQAPAQFNRSMQVIQTGGEPAKRLIKQLVDEIKSEREEEERGPGWKDQE